MTDTVLTNEQLALVSLMLAANNIHPAVALGAIVIIAAGHLGCSLAEAQEWACRQINATSCGEDALACPFPPEIRAAPGTARISGGKGHHRSADSVKPYLSESAKRYFASTISHLTKQNPGSVPRGLRKDLCDSINPRPQVREYGIVEI